MITATPVNWTADGDSSRRMTAKMTESAGWSVSVIDVSAAGSRGRAAAISSQPTTCDVNASTRSQPCSGHVGSSSSSPRAAPTGSVTTAAERVAQ
ncbi:MAG TPA: hypothetical protein VJ744_06710 [Gaiellaceae bacterium]|nr:hypothetical protein [Gaiellaceae bacterium]